MGVEFLSDDILLVNLPSQPQRSDEFQLLNTMFSETIDRDVVMDFSEVQTLTSESICGLLILAKLLGGAGYEFVLCGVPPAINDIFDRTGLQSVFEFCDTRAEALKLIEDRKGSFTGA